MRCDSEGRLALNNSAALKGGTAAVDKGVVGSGLDARCRDEPVSFTRHRFFFFASGWDAESILCMIA